MHEDYKIYIVFLFFFGGGGGVCIFRGCLKKDIIIPFNPLSPGVLDPSNYSWGGDDPPLYFGFLRLFKSPSINVAPHID